MPVSLPNTMQALFIVAIVIYFSCGITSGRYVDLSYPSVPDGLPSRVSGTIINGESLGRRMEWPQNWESAANDEFWTLAVCKGDMLGAGMFADPENAGVLFTPPRLSSQSVFSSFPAEFVKWGWDVQEIVGEECNFEYQWGIREALRGMGSSGVPHNSNGGSVWCYKVRHYRPEDAYDEEGDFDINDQTYQVDGRTYRMTGANFILAMDPTQGVLVGLSRYGPIHEGKDRNPPIANHELPLLRSASDIMWGAYKLPSGSMNIRWLVSATITNKATTSIIKRVLDMRHASLMPWPGLYIRFDSEEGRALLGTPNAQGFGYLLIQRKEELGKKFIFAVRVFHTSSPDPLPCLAFEIRDVPPGVGGTMDGISLAG
ncbi:hypothetical protein BU24DRAFT_488006 [Aaosphaeria arxii CBS 175.79]|uniref:Uncharacterized protein n=1 Tax=Aaosphaeria arxii CBS 175.79 TaxID=1450172 RepID=A0A6A5Y9Z0_9PLEO|nr:uncharacterized protein BU24DRAFT_488006 [Aaosphaeria arxii CBS 175.79]KAF2021620.1 hypothetical protein BU24DRAFT_488006 [Aaosphaeria arxii CBS 175.79]